MIRVRLERERTSRAIRAFRVTGHAEYAEPGRDIVCSAVSAVTVGTVNAVEVLTGVRLKATMRHGDLNVRIPEHDDADRRERVQLLLESMVVMLRSIVDSYGEYVTIQEHLTEEGGRPTC